jgi:arsenate reductase-like glutaredoxin family protein
MAKSVDWYYHRNSCTTCGKSQGFLAKNNIAPKDIVSANKIKIQRAEALKLAKAASSIIVARGKSVRRFNMLKSPPTDDELLSAILGPTGNLRAPAIRKGKTLYVGFNEEEYQKLA